MSDAEPTSRQILREVLLYAALVVAVGAAIVAARVAKDGPQVLSYDPRGAAAEEPADAPRPQ